MLIPSVIGCNIGQKNQQSTGKRPSYIIFFKSQTTKLNARVCKSRHNSILFAENREHMGNFAVEVRRVALQLMKEILESLGLGKDYQHEKSEEGLQLMLVNC
jgi:isopenicillin N synthase-like dioxygenase